MSLLRTICSLTQRSLRGKYNVYSNIEFNGRRVMSSSGSFLFYRKTISRIVSPPVMSYAPSFPLCFNFQSPLPTQVLHGIVAMRSLSYEVPIADITVVDVEKTCQKVPMEDLKKTYPDRTVIINDVDDLFLSAACGDKLRELQAVARGSSLKLSSKRSKLSENEFKAQAKMLLDGVHQRFLEYPNADRVYVPGISFNKEMMRLLYEGKRFHMRLAQEYDGEVRMEFGLIADIIMAYDSVEEAMEKCGESLYLVLALCFLRDEVFADSNGVYNGDLHYYNHYKASDKEIYEAWVTIVKFSTNQIVVNVSGMSIVDKNNVSWSD